MAWLGVVVAAAIIGITFVDAFEAMILPRRVRHSFRPARFFYRTTWSLWRGLAIWLPAGRWGNGFFSVFGPLSLFALLVAWAVGLITGFAILHWSLSTALSQPNAAATRF